MICNFSDNTAILTGYIPQNLKGAVLCEDYRMTLGEWLDKWLNEHMAFSIRESTKERYRSYCGYIKPHLGHKQVSAITTAEVQKMYNQLKANGRKENHPTMGHLDRVIGSVDDVDTEESNDTAAEVPSAEEPSFEPVKGKYRKRGTGYVKQLSANCWQGRYTPTVNGKRESHNVYGETEAECEAKLAEMIKEVKAELRRA